MSYFEDLCRRLSLAEDERAVHKMKGEVALGRTQNRLKETDQSKLNPKNLKRFQDANVDVLWQEGALKADDKVIALQRERIQYQSELIRKMLTLHKISELEKQLILDDAQLASKDPDSI